MNVLFQSRQVRVFDFGSGSTRKESMWRLNMCLNYGETSKFWLIGSITWVSSLKKEIGKTALQPQKVYTIPRVPLCLSPHPNWVRPSRERVCAPGTQGGQHMPSDEGVGGPNSDEWRESLALCLLCVYSHFSSRMRPLVEEVRPSVIEHLFIGTTNLIYSFSWREKVTLFRFFLWKFG